MVFETEKGFSLVSVIYLEINQFHQNLDECEVHYVILWQRIVLLAY